tara:strand:+ start:1906 stop:2424 length:519 start_codon:yes stop_codon:yes gene_type:complete
MVVIVHDALDVATPGIIACTPPDSFRMPFRVEWVHNNVPITDETAFDIDHTRLCARAACPGRYTIHVRDALDNEVCAQTDVRQIRVPRIMSYAGRPVTSSMSRNGKVQVIVEDAPPGCKYLWTHGVVTMEPVLHHAQMGTYATTLISADGKPLTFLHIPLPYQLGCNPDLLA